MICPLKPGLECMATSRLADASRCRCPLLVYIDIRADRDDAPLLLVDDPGDYTVASMRALSPEVTLA